MASKAAELRAALEKSLGDAQTNRQFSLEHNSDDKYWAAQGSIAAYRHAIFLLEIYLVDQLVESNSSDAAPKGQST